MFNKVSPTGQEIYKEIECTYKASLLKKKANTFMNESVLNEMHEKSLNTLEVLHMNLIATDVTLANICQYYKEATRENVIKLLLRCKNLYEARTEVKRILLLVLKTEALSKWLATLISQPYGEEHKVFEFKHLVERVRTCLHQFRHEHKIFKGSFIFKGEDYEAMCDASEKMVLDFISKFNIVEPDLLVKTMAK